MAEAIAPADAEALLVAHLAAVLAVPVATRVPNPRPPSMVRLSLADTTRQTAAHFYSRLIVECWAPTEPAAAALARTAYAHTVALEGEDAGADWVGDVVEVGGPANFPEPEVGPRYQFTVDLLISGELI